MQEESACLIDSFNYANSKPGVWFAREDEIADWALKTPQRLRYWTAVP
jgi:hypothetical protein